MSEVSYVDVIFVLVTGFIAYHGITYRDKNGDKPWLHLFFGCIAALYGLWVLGRDILHFF
ncbi:MAG: hypothetical protein HQ517_04035 [SAR324 cluster bacterium]|nr:hypothetical protein [SAR324 cluster bacterium]